MILVSSKQIMQNLISKKKQIMQNKICFDHLHSCCTVYEKNRVYFKKGVRIILLSFQTKLCKTKYVLIICTLGSCRTTYEENRVDSRNASI
jgi:hypothetical protein